MAFDEFYSAYGLLKGSEVGNDGLNGVRAALPDAVKCDMGLEDQVSFHRSIGFAMTGQGFSQNACRGL